MRQPILLVADKNNKIYDMPDSPACGMAGNKLYLLNKEDLIPLPPASEIFILPDRYPVIFKKNKFVELKNSSPVAAFIPPGYTGLLTPAYKEKPKAKILPLFSYTPIAWYKNRFYVPAVRSAVNCHDGEVRSAGGVKRNGPVQANCRVALDVKDSYCSCWRFWQLRSGRRC